METIKEEIIKPELKKNNHIDNDELEDLFKDLSDNKQSTDKIINNIIETAIPIWKFLNMSESSYNEKYNKPIKNLQVEDLEDS